MRRLLFDLPRGVRLAGGSIAGLGTVAGAAALDGDHATAPQPITAGAPDKAHVRTAESMGIRGGLPEWIRVHDPRAEQPRAGRSIVEVRSEAARAKPRKSKMRRRWDRYARIVRAHGGKVNPGGRPTVLGIRKYDAASSRYTDKIVVLLPNHRVKIFRGSLHPGQSSSTLATDANRDGVGDVGMLRPGNYVAVPNGSHHGEPSFHVLTRQGGDPLPGWRDTNHDGRFSSAERRASRHRGDRVTEILFHVGLPGAVSSIGCPNLPPDQIDAFVRAVGGPNGRFNVTLIDR
jgi:hypothetical protein